MSELFPFRFFDPIRDRWIQARYKATRADIAARHEALPCMAAYFESGPGYHS